MIHALKVSQPTLLIVDKKSLAVASKAAQKISLPQTQLLLIEGNVNGYDSLQKIVTGKTEYIGQQIPKWNFAKGQTSRNTCALLCFSSGTTGLPKAVGSSFGHRSKL